MYCWHYKLIQSLPDELLKEQLDSCVHMAENISIYGFPDDTSVNDVMKFPIQQFRDYCNMVIFELNRRNYHVQRSTVAELDTFIGFELDMTVLHKDIFKGWHDDTKLEQDFRCGYELYDFTDFNVCSSIN